MQLAGGKVGGFPCLKQKVQKINKKFPEFGEKNPVCLYLWVKFSFKIQF